MVITSNCSSYPGALCDGCSKESVCKYADEVQAYVSSHRAPPEIDCLSVVYKCKYFDAYNPYTIKTLTNVYDAQIASCSTVDKI